MNVYLAFPLSVAFVLLRPRGLGAAPARCPVAAGRPDRPWAAVQVLVAAGRAAAGSPYVASAARPIESLAAWTRPWDPASEPRRSSAERGPYRVQRLASPQSETREVSLVAGTNSLEGFSAGPTTAAVSSFRRSSRSLWTSCPRWASFCRSAASNGSNRSGLSLLFVSWSSGAATTGRLSLEAASLVLSSLWAAHVRGGRASS